VPLAVPPAPGRMTRTPGTVTIRVTGTVALAAARRWQPPRPLAASLSDSDSDSETTAMTGGVSVTPSTVTVSLCPAGVTVSLPVWPGPGVPLSGAAAAGTCGLDSLTPAPGGLGPTVTSESEAMSRRSRPPSQ
jgi:hypothetical protein